MCRLGLSARFVRTLAYGIILRSYSMQYYGIALQIYITELHDGLILRNYTTESYYGITLQNYMTELCYRIIL